LLLSTPRVGRPRRPRGATRDRYDSSSKVFAVVAAAVVVLIFLVIGADNHNF
jgi:hypothetical protein